MMPHQSPLWISEADVVSLMNLGEAINVLERGLLAEARGDAQNMVKTHATWDKGSTLHAIGAVFAKDGFAGTKTWAHTEGGATPLLILFDSDNGSLKALMNWRSSAPASRRSHRSPQSSPCVRSSAFASSAATKSAARSSSRE